MGKIAFLNLPSPFLEDSLWVYPYGLVQLATEVEKRAHYVNFFDLNTIVARNGVSLSEIIDSIREETVGISVVSAQFEMFKKVAGLLREKGKRIIAGGPHASCLPTDLLDAGADLVVKGEGENAIDDMMNGAKGIIEREPVADLCSIPFAARYMTTGYLGPAPIMASRGCAWSCRFCSKPVKRKMVFRSPENVVREILSIKKRKVIFFDDSFTANHDWVGELCELIRGVGLDKEKTFRCSTRSDLLTRRVIRQLRSSGFKEVCIGIESGSQSILDIIGKGTTVGMNTEARRMCREDGLALKAYIMVGCPGETPDTVAETRNWLRENRPDTTSIYLFTPLPGSKIWSSPEEFGIRIVDKRMYYGGKRRDMEATVETEAMSREAITFAYRSLLEEFDAA